MAIHFRNGNYCSDNLLDGDDRLYTLVPGYRVGVHQRLIPDDEEIGLAEPDDGGKTATVRFRPAAEQVRRLRAGEIVDQTIRIETDRIVAGAWYPAG